MLGKHNAAVKFYWTDLIVEQRSSAHPVRPLFFFPPLLAVLTSSVSTQTWLYGFDCNVTTVGEDATSQLYPGDSQTQ